MATHVSPSSILSMLLSALTVSISSRIPKDTLVIPSGVALSLNVFYIIYLLISALRDKSNDDTDAPALVDGHASSISFQRIRARANGHGGWTVYAFAVGRLTGCILLFALSVTTIHLSLGSIITSPARVLFRHPETFMALTYVCFFL